MPPLSRLPVYGSDVQTDILLFKSKASLIKPLNLTAEMGKIESLRALDPTLSKKIAAVDEMKKRQLQISATAQQLRIWMDEFERLGRDEIQLDRSINNQLHQCLRQEKNSDVSKSISNLLTDAAEDSATQNQSRDRWQRTINDLARFVRSKREEGFTNAQKTHDDAMKLRKLNEDQMAKLNAESHALEDQVSELIKGLSVDSKCLDQDTWNPWIQVDGYAMPFLELTCVDVLLEQERQQSYQALFESYQSDMESLESKYADVVSNPTSGWSKSSHTAFVKLQLEFASQCQNRLKLMYDRFKLTVKDKTVSKSAFNQHDVWVSQSESYKNQRYSTNEWYKSHIKGFIERTKALYQEAEVMQDKLLSKQADLETRVEKTIKDHELLKDWRLKRMAQLQRMEELMAQERINQLEIQAKELEKQNQKKAQQKDEIKKYQSKLEEFRARQRDLQEKERLTRRPELLKRSKRNQERISYRRQELLEQERQRRILEAEDEERKLAQERRLDELRAQVQVHATSDPDRLFQDTQSHFISKQAAKKSTSLFAHFGYNMEEIFKDKRSRLSLALHMQGLQHSDYGRQMLRSLVPEPTREFKSQVVL